ncbi:MAG TPA: hypothetical protein VKA59_27095 [Vicinamibacterales bacterium]|nr:hypothetical protein [Vicinamibacterales bacterium]
MALTAKATEPWHLFALRAAQGLLAGYGSLTLTMAARSAPPEQMASAIGAVQAAQRFGPAIGSSDRRGTRIRVIFALQVVGRSFGPVLLLHLTRLGYTSGRAEVLVGVLFSALALSAVFGHQLAAVVLRRTTARAVIVVALLAATMSLLLFTLVESAVLMLVAMAAFGISAGTALTTSFYGGRIARSASRSWCRRRISDGGGAHRLRISPALRGCRP